MDGLTFFGHLPYRLCCGSMVLLLVQGSPRPVLPTPSKWGNSAFLGDIPGDTGPIRWWRAGFFVGVPFNIRKLGDFNL